MGLCVLYLSLSSSSFQFYLVFHLSSSVFLSVFPFLWPYLSNSALLYYFLSPYINVFLHSSFFVSSSLNKLSYSKHFPLPSLPCSSFVSSSPLKLCVIFFLCNPWSVSSSSEIEPNFSHLLVLHFTFEQWGYFALGLFVFINFPHELLPLL